jgi:RecB family exonuclease
LIEEALRRAGVPGYFPRGTARPDPAGRAFLALLACAAEGCPASRFAEYLSLAQVPKLSAAGAPLRERVYQAAMQDELLAGFARDTGVETTEEPAPGLEAPFGWEQLLVDAAVVGGRERWRRRLDGLARELRLQLERLSSDDEGRRGVIERRQSQLGALAGFALPLVDMLSSLPRGASWGEWIEQLTAVAETALRRPESVVSILNELRPMTNVGPVGLDEVYRVLEDRLRFLRRDPPARRFGAVWVGSIEEARGRTFEAVFLPGLAEGLFPRRASEDPLLIDAHRAALNAGLANQDQRVARERLLLHIGAAAGARLVVSYPRMDVVQSRPRVPSFYAIEVIRAARGSFPDLKQFEKTAARAAATRLGWPAPREAQQALDDAEFDLATLERALRLPQGQAKGAARYLMQASPILARSLRARWQRWSEEWSPADGLVSVREIGKNMIEAHRLNARLYSATTLEQYTACPYKFYLRGIQELRPREEAAPLEQLDPATRGALFHEIQHEIYEAGTFEAGDLETALDAADRITDRVASRYEEELAPAIPRVWQTEIEELRRDLRAWVRHVVRVGRDWTPVRSEMKFGDPPVEIATAARLRGAIDLVERHRERPVLRITDHKTGRPPETLPIYVGGGASLQPILYSLAAEQILGQKVDYGRLFYCTHRGNYKELEIRMSEAARAHAVKALGVIDKAIEDTFLPAAPREGACAVCDYRLVCGPYEEQRWLRKQGKRAAGLEELRGMP